MKKSSKKVRFDLEGNTFYDNIQKNEEIIEIQTSTNSQSSIDNEDITDDAPLSTRELSQTQESTQDSVKDSVKDSVPKEKGSRQKTPFMYFRKDKINCNLPYKTVVKRWREEYNSDKKRQKWIQLASIENDFFIPPDLETARTKLKKIPIDSSFNFE